MFLHYKIANIMHYMKSLYSITEAHHLEAYNSEPILGFFSEPIKIYFQICVLDTARHNIWYASVYSH